MKNFKLTILFCLLTAVSFSQVQLCLGEDAIVCQGQTVQITNCAQSGGGAPVGGLNLSNPTIISPNLSDDSWSGVVNIGFSFNFYGTNYTQCIIGSNGLISFNIANAGGYCAYAMQNTGPLPSTTYLPTARNTIMNAYQDIHPSLAGTTGNIQYQTMGTAPNRTFVVLYREIGAFSCGLSECNYTAIILHETSNDIELHIGKKTSCGTWNGGLAIQGVQNAAGTAATITPGRNNTVWTALNDGRLFTPTSPTNTLAYTTTSIPYLQVTGVGSSLIWNNTNNQTFPYNNGVLNINSIPTGTTGYFLTGSACGTALGAITDTTWITRSNVVGTPAATTDYCSNGVGTAALTNPIGDAPFTYSWNPTGQTTQTATNLVAGSYVVTVTTAQGCTKNYTVVVPNNVPQTTSSTTQVSCPGGSDGTATANFSPTMPNLSYNWYDAGGQTTPTATGLSAGVYHCEISSANGCIDTVEVTITEIPGMIASTVSQTDVTCNSGDDGTAVIHVEQGTGPYSFSWNLSQSADSIANDLNANTHTVTITDANSCVITHDVVIGEPLPLKISFLSPDITICAEDSTQLTAQATGGSSAYIYTWTSNGTVVGNTQTITVDPVQSGTQYCLKLTEQCGSPQKDSCMVISFPTELIPAIVPDRYSDCQPATFVFSNNTNNPSEIATTYLVYGNGMDTLLNGNASSSSTFVDPQTYTLDATVVSIYGCVYTKTFPAIVEAIEIPTANFGVSPNPTTFFETTVSAVDNSSSSVTSWQWIVPDATPAFSTTQNQTFKFPEGEVGEYPMTLIVTTPEGCKDTITRKMVVISDIIFYAPNAFTPDGDELNQTWGFYVAGIDVYEFNMKIFNRWGQTVWESNDPSAHWDGTYGGKIVQEGAYIWVATVKDMYSDLKKDFSGSITVIR